MRLRFWQVAFGLAFALAAAGSALPATVHVPAASATCYPPVPNFVQAYPISGSGGVSTEVGLVVFEAPEAVSVRAWRVELGAPEEPLVRGGHLGSPPSPLPSPIASLEPGYRYVAAGIPTLQPNTGYQVRLIDTRLRCLGPVVTGVFATQ